MFSATPAANAAAPGRMTWPDYGRLRHELIAPPAGTRPASPAATVAAGGRSDRPDQLRAAYYRCGSHQDLAVVPVSHAAYESSGDSGPDARSWHSSS